MDWKRLLKRCKNLQEHKMSRNKIQGKFQGRIAGKAVRGSWPKDGYAPPINNRRQAKEMGRLFKSTKELS